jgi:succinyl-CoA synthetase alpha subunit
MSILINKKTIALVQGISGKEGSRAAREMQSYGTRVVAGVTPGKGGEKVDGVPVYETVADAMAKHPEVNASLVMVPAAFAKDAALEAIFAKISLVVIITEHIPTQDAALLVACARRAGVRIVGPSSIGIISPGEAKIGSIGSGESSGIFMPGPVGIISKSGGMTGEIAVNLTRAGIGQSTALGIGGDVIIGSDYVDMLKLFKEDKKTRAVVLFGEVGGTYEELAAQYIIEAKFGKPVVAVIAGHFTELLPAGTTLGHAGAIVARGRGGYDSKIKAFKKAGVHIARTVDEVPAILKKLL